MGESPRSRLYRGGKTRIPQKSASSFCVGADAPSAQPSAARLQELSRIQPPGWRPADQTRAPPPHQAKSRLDGDPGVWAYVCIAL